MQTQLRPTWTNEAYDFVMQRLREEGFVGYAVGGCVRDGLMGLSPKDVDVATNARPHDLPKLFGTKPWDGDNEVRTADNGVALYPTGVAHGTWTVRVNDDIVEVTTFRRDVDTDGRRATVAFADTIEEDAQRRDFTMNALYLDWQFVVHDPTGTGVEDLRRGVVRFVGNADQRIQEDYLRIMRLFRFHARFGRGPMDRDAWEAAARHRGGLSAHVSKERVWDELKKLLSLHAPAEAVWEMGATDVLQEVLDVREVPERFGRVLRKERQHNLEPNWVSRYVALSPTGLIPFPASNEEKKRAAAAADAWEAWACQYNGTLSSLSHQFGPEAATCACLLDEHLRYNASCVDRGAIKTMPLVASDLLDRGFEPGPGLGKALAAAKKFWYSTDLRADKKTLMVVALDELEHTDGS